MDGVGSRAFGRMIPQAMNSLSRPLAWIALLLVLLTAGYSFYRYKEILLVESWEQEIFFASEEASLPDSFLLSGLIFAESRGRSDAISSIGALGLCQLMPSTAAELALRYKIAGPPYSARDNILLGAHYLKEMHQRFGDWDLALLGYRLGPGRVAREIERWGGKISWVEFMEANPPSPWTYRNQIIEHQEIFRQRFRRYN